MAVSFRPDRLGSLSSQGVSVWLDGMSRAAIRRGDLASAVRDRHVVGAVTGTRELVRELQRTEAYDDLLAGLARRRSDPVAAAREVVAEDARTACEQLREVYEATGGVDGWFSAAVAAPPTPDAAVVLAGGRALRTAVDRPNLLVGVPATPDGLTALTALVAEGVGVDVGPIFSVARYRRVVAAHLRGLELAGRAGLDLAAIHVVVSFGVRPLDDAADARLVRSGDSTAGGLRGRVGVANARLAYEVFEEVTTSMRWRELAARGARAPRLLWRPTAPAAAGEVDLARIGALVAPETVVAMDAATLESFASQGVVDGDAVHGTYTESRRVLRDLGAAGVAYDELTAGLERRVAEEARAAWAELVAAAAQRLQTVA